MISKSVSPYLSFFFALKCIALIFVSSNLYAATVDMTNNNLPLPYISFHPQLDKERKNSYPIQNTSTNNNTSNSTVSVQYLANITPTQDKPDTPSKNNSYDKNTTSIKAFLDKNADNALLQGSLLTFGKAKKLFNETENKLNAMTQHMLLEIDLYNQLEPLLIQNDYATRSFNFVNQQENNSLVTHDQNITDSKKEFSLIKEILRITTLYYIFALIIVAIFFKWLLKFLLFGKYK